MRRASCVCAVLPARRHRQRGGHGRHYSTTLCRQRPPRLQVRIRGHGAVEIYGPWRWGSRPPFSRARSEAPTRRQDHARSGDAAVQPERRRARGLRRAAGPGSYSPPHQPQRRGDILGRAVAAPQRPITDHPLPPAGPACACKVSSQGRRAVPARMTRRSAFSRLLPV